MTEDEIVERTAEPIAREYKLALEGLRNSVKGVPEEQWGVAQRPGDAFPRHACHLLFGIEASLDGHKVKHGQRYGVPVESFQKRVDAYPSRDSVLAHIDEIEGKIDGWVTKFARKAMTGARKQHNPMNRVAYMLRHTAVHLAYFRREMYHRGIPRPVY